MNQQQDSKTAAGLSPDLRTVWYFTFGSNHIHPVTGESLTNAYVTYVGTCDEARAKMIAAFGTKWSMQYASSLAAGVERFGLEEVPRPEEFPQLIRFPERRTAADAPVQPLGDLSPTKAAAIAALTPAPVRSGDLLAAQLALGHVYGFGNYLAAADHLRQIKPDAALDVLHAVEWMAATLRVMTPQHAAMAAAVLTPDAEVTA